MMALFPHILASESPPSRSTRSGFAARKVTRLVRHLERAKLRVLDEIWILDLLSSEDKHDVSVSEE